VLELTEGLEMTLYHRTLWVMLLACSPLTYGFVGGHGTAESPYQISTKAHLEAVNDDLSAHYILINDIDFTHEPNYRHAVIAPIGDSWYSGGFRGRFDGNGKKIIGLTIHGEVFGEYYVGLFGAVEESGFVCDLAVENCHVSGIGRVGALAGENNGFILNCYTTGDISGDWAIGGLSGWNWGAIIGSYSAGRVNGNEIVGGLVGQNCGTLVSCYATGSVTGSVFTGGLAGSSSGVILRSYSSGPVIGSRVFGGLVGEFYSDDSVIVDCFWDTVTSGVEIAYTAYDSVESVYSPVYSTIGIAEGKTTLQMQLLSTFTTAGWDFVAETANGIQQIWQMPQESGYPQLSAFHDFVPVGLDGDGSESAPYLIGDANELAAIAHYNPDACYRLTNDIDLSGIHWLTAVIPYFSGRLDGNGFRINHLTITKGGFLGLIGLIGSGGEIYDLGLENVNIMGQCKYVGSLAAYNQRGIITNSYSTGSVCGEWLVGGLVAENEGAIKNCYSFVTVDGDEDVGGLVGCNGDLITESYATGAVTGQQSLGGLAGSNDELINCSYSTGSVDGTDYIGGFVGGNSDTINDCYSTGDVNAASSNVGGFAGLSYDSIIHCYSTGKVTGSGAYVGGFAGSCFSWCITDCYFPATAGPNNGFGTALSDFQMKQKSRFSGWDFLGESTHGDFDIWRLCMDGIATPKLSFEFAKHGDLACGDGVDIHDLLVLVEHWLTHDQQPSFYSLADVDSDGVVDLKDFSTLAENWLVEN
jgi:hypothetical protein